MKASCWRCSSPSAGRVTPRCAHFGVCGGCALQHLSPEAQLAAKETELRDNLERVGARRARSAGSRRCAGPVWGYRRRARLGAKYVTQEGTRGGRLSRARSRPTSRELQHCEVLAPPVGALIAPLAAAAQRPEHPRAAAADRGGGRRQCASRWCCACWTAPSAADLGGCARSRAAHGVRMYLQTGGLRLGARARCGPPRRTAALRAAAVRCGAASSRRPTSSRSTARSTRRWCSARRRAARRRLPPPPCSICFAGSATSPCRWRGARRASSASRASGARRARPAQRAPQRHRQRRVPRRRPRRGAGCRTAAVAAGTLHARAARSAAGSARARCWPTVARLAPQRLLYISCHPGSLARDLGVLVHEHGFDARGGRRGRHVSAHGARRIPGAAEPARGVRAAAATRT